MTSQRSRQLLACFTGFGLTILAAAPAIAEPADPPARSRCVVNVTSPLQGDKVGKEGRVVGAAQIPPGTYVHLLAHPKDYEAEWWPQMNRSAMLKGANGDFVMIAGYGTKNDIDSDFEIAVVVVGEDDHKRLVAYQSDIKKIAYEQKQPPDWTPIPFPTVVEGCPPVLVTVRKTSHQ